MMALIFISVATLQSQTVKTVGQTGSDYSTLRAAFLAINSGSISGAIELKIMDNTIETDTVKLNASGTGSANYTSVKIYAGAAGKTITGSIAGPMIYLNGADSVTIDGRLNRTGSNIGLTISNTNSAATPGVHTIRFSNDASNNTIKYCLLKGSGLNTGMIMIGETTLSTGNDNNTLENNSITNAEGNRPIRAIIAIGTTGKENSGNIISSNNFFDIMNLNTANTANAIYIGPGNSSFSINGNSIYETNVITPANNGSYTAIYIATTTSSHTISGNYIGGNAPQCGGTALTKTNNGNNQFIGISLGGSTSSASDIQGNVIRKIDWANSSNASFYGIQSDGAKVNIGNTTGNHIGIADGTGSIVINNVVKGGLFSGISVAGNGDKVVSGNYIGGITTSNLSVNNTDFYGISFQGSANNTVSFNMIGSTTISNSIHLSSPSTASDAPQKCYGIIVRGTGINTITENTISNMNNGTSNTNGSTAGLIRGIDITSGTNVITGNTIRDISIANAYNYQNSNASAIGIVAENNSATEALNISGNTIFNISNVYASFIGSVIGICVNWGNTPGTISRNFIHALSVNSNAGASISGIRGNGGTTSCANNVISLYEDNAAQVTGFNADGTIQLYFNTVYIGGSPASGSYQSFAFNSSAGTRNFRNNIFVNERQNSGTANGNHYAIKLQNNSGLTINYNNYYVSGSGGILGRFGSADITALANWKTTTGQDGSSLSANPLFEDAGGTLATDYLPSESSLVAATGAGILTDYRGTTRSLVYPAMGAFEYTVFPCISPTSGGLIAARQTICHNAVPNAFSSLSAASGHTGTLRYQWQSSTDSIAFSDITTATETTYAPGVLTQNTWFRRLSGVTCDGWKASGYSNVLKITVKPLFSAGTIVHTGERVCFGGDPAVISNASLPGGGDGNFSYQWQISTIVDSTDFSGITGATSASYDPPAGLTETSWYRRLVRDGTCNTTFSPSAGIQKVEVLETSGDMISGYARYENNPQTPLEGLKIILMRGDNPVDSTITNAAGHYTFAGLSTDTYGLRIEPAHPSGQWQTWGGVNNTDYLLVSRHVANTLLLPVNPPVVRVSASVKATHPTINSTDANAIRQAAKFPSSGWSYFDIPKWVFSGVNVAGKIDTIELNCNNVIRDIRGLCAGDVNGTYVPVNGYKMAAPALEFVSKGTLPLTRELVFPVRAEADMELGAITLMLDYDPALIEITGVKMPENGGVEPWFEVQSSRFKVGGNLNQEPETLNILHIGWMSLNPVNVVAGQTVLMIRARVNDDVVETGLKPVSTAGHTIRFSLNPNPLSELADGEGNVIENAKLSIADAAGNVEMVKWRNGEIGLLSVYPNPAKELLNVEWVVEDAGEVQNFGTLQLLNMQGIEVARLDVADAKSGLNKTRLDVSNLPNGAYMLRVVAGEIVRVVKVVVNR